MTGGAFSVGLLGKSVACLMIGEIIGPGIRLMAGEECLGRVASCYSFVREL